MNAQLITFFILAIIAIAAALGMLFSRSAVYSGLFLVLNFGTVAVFYILLNAPFIAMAQVSVYAGAIMVLFLFVIMLLGTELLPPTNALPWQRPLAIFLGLIFLLSRYICSLFAKPRPVTCLNRSKLLAVRRQWGRHYSALTCFHLKLRPCCC